MRFFICNHCGNIIEMIKDIGVPVFCCGEEMTELVPGTTDAATEKHVPEVRVDGNKVKVTVGTVEHPMTDDHYIEWIAVETEKGEQMIKLSPNAKPEAEFILSDDDKFVAAYAYCGLHGLWKN